MEGGTVVAAAVLTNLVVSNVVVHALGKKSASLRAYYRELNTTAVLLDTTSLAWGVLLAQRVSSKLAVQVAAAVVIQQVHDVAFGLYLKAYPDAAHRTKSLFAAYAEEHGAGILFVDACFMAVGVVLSHALGNWKTKDVTLAAIVGLYIHLMLLDSL